MARKLQPHEKDLFPIVSTINEVVDGRSNNCGSVENGTGATLVPGATTTTVNFETMSTTSVILLSARTANAAAALSTTYVSNKMNGSFILTHLNNAQTDRTFDFSCVGG